MSAEKTASQPKGSYLLVTICILLLLLVIGLLVAWAAGSVRGQEIDVVSWDIRSFSYVRNPLTGAQVTHIRHDNMRSGIDAAVLPYFAGGPLEPKGARWDLLNISVKARSAVGDAQILLDYLGAWGSNSNLYWSEWTTAHPAEAAILWTAVRDTVHLSRYEKLPDLFEAARAHPSLTELKPLIAAIMLDITLQESRAALKAGEGPWSQSIAKQGLTYGASQDLKSLAEGREAVGTTEDGIRKDSVEAERTSVRAGAGRK